MPNSSIHTHTLIHTCDIDGLTELQTSLNFIEYAIQGQKDKARFS